MSPDPATPIAPQPVIPARRSAPPAPRPAARAAAARPERSAFGRVARTLGVLLLIAVLAAVIAGAVLLLTDAGQDTNLGELLKQEITDQVQSLKDFIEENTQ